MIMSQTLLFGGGIINQRQLSPKIRAEVHHLLADYVQHPSVLHHLDDDIVPPGWATGGHHGRLGIGDGDVLKIDGRPKMRISPSSVFGPRSFL